VRGAGLIGLVGGALWVVLLSTDASPRPARHPLIDRHPPRRSFATRIEPELQCDGLHLRHEPVCLQQALEGVAEMVAPAAASKGLELAFLIDPAVLSKGPHFFGDATRLRQVLHHLVSNAVKYSDSGAVVVRAGLSGGGGDGGGGDAAGAAASPPTLAISVRDRGIGMSPDLLSGLFQSFRTGSDALDRRYGGTGLGLALSKRLAEAMGGDILVESALGEGSTFTLVLRPSWCADEEGEDAGAGDAAAGAGAGATEGANGGSSSTLSSTADAACGSASSSGDLSSGSTCGSPPPRNSISSMQPSSVSSDLDGEGCMCSCTQAHAHARGQLAGKTVMVDVAQQLVAEQTCQMLSQLGMRPLPMRAAHAHAHACDAGRPEAADLAVVSACRVAAALRNGWRGRPLVVIGSPEEVPERLHPLVVAVSKPLRLGRMVAALQRAAGMLSWQGGAENAPRLGRAPARLLQPGAAAFGPGAQGVASPSGPVVFAGAGGSGRGDLQQQRWRQRASIDNSALRHSPLSAPAAPVPSPLAVTLQAGHQQQQAAGIDAAVQQQLLSPPPLDLASSATKGGSVAAADKPQGAAVRLAEAVKAVFSPKAAAAAAAAAAAPPPTPLRQPSDAQEQEGWASPSLGGSFTAAAARPPVAPSAAAQHPQPQQQQAPKPPLNILIAEDNRVNQMVLLKVLQAVLPGCKPDVVANGLQVLEAVEKKSYQLIFMDGERGPGIAGAGAAAVSKGWMIESVCVRPTNSTPPIPPTHAPTHPQSTCPRWMASPHPSASATRARPRPPAPALSPSPPTRSRRCASGAQRRGSRRSYRSRSGLKISSVSWSGLGWCPAVAQRPPLQPPMVMPTQWGAKVRPPRASGQPRRLRR